MCIIIQRDVCTEIWPECFLWQFEEEAALLGLGGRKVGVLQVKGSQGAGKTFQAKEQQVPRAEEEIMVLEGPVSSSICW